MRYRGPSAVVAKIKLTGLVAVAVLVGATFAATNSLVPAANQEPYAPPAPTASPPEKGAPAPSAPVRDQTSTVRSGDPEPAAREPTRTTAVVCPANTAMRGTHVSAIARDRLRGRAHGRAVAAAAKNQCGKPVSDVQDAPKAGEGDRAIDSDSGGSAPPGDAADPTESVEAEQADDSPDPPESPDHADDSEQTEPGLSAKADRRSKRHQGHGHR